MKPAARKRLTQAIWTILFFGPPLVLIGYVAIDNMSFGPRPEAYNTRVAAKLGSLLCDALNEYSEDRGVYPDCVLGGSREWFEDVQSPDPLLKYGYVKDYPRRYVLPKHVIYTGPRPYVSLRSATYSGISPDPRGSGSHMKNLVSTLSDGFMEYLRYTFASPRILFGVQPPNESSEVAADEFLIKRELQQLSESLKVWESLKGRAVFLAAGGVPPVDKGLYGLSYYSVVPDKLEDRLSSWSSVTRELQDTIGGNFGYVRGEYMGAGEKAAFLWMYGVPTQSDRHQGLDVLNAETGELKPDGIPDGICILYELKNGEVVNVARAEDM